MGSLRSSGSKYQDFLSTGIEFHALFEHILKSVQAETVCSQINPISRISNDLHPPNALGSQVFFEKQRNVGNFGRIDTKGFLSNSNNLEGIYNRHWKNMIIC